MSVVVRRVRLRNYRSITAADVALGSLTILVGRNGSGKSNFLDVLRFTADALSTTLEAAFRQRGGLNEVRRRSDGHPSNFSILLELELPSVGPASFAFEVAAQPNGGFIVKKEVARIEPICGETAAYVVESGRLVQRSENLSVHPAVMADSLFLTSVSGLEAFRPLYSALTAMAFYSINPDEIRALQAYDGGEKLARSGRNIASVLRRMERDRPDDHRRVEAYLRAIVPGIEGVQAKPLGPAETLVFRQTVQSNHAEWRFFATAMSDGTLRSVGNLVALFQSDTQGQRPTLVGLEEPESTLHPGAAGILMDAIVESSQRQQVIVTTHSPDLLDHRGLDVDAFRIVTNPAGETSISVLNSRTRKLVEDSLFTVGELLRQDQLVPAVPRLPQPGQTDVFPA